MKLSTWLNSKNMSTSDFAMRLGITKQAVHRYIASTRLPRKEIIKKIELVTNGDVSALDWFKADEEAA